MGIRVKGDLQALVQLRADRDITKSHHNMSDTRGPDHWNSVHDCRRITGSESISQSPRPLRLSQFPQQSFLEKEGACVLMSQYCVRQEDMQEAVPPSLVWLSGTRSRSLHLAANPSTGSKLPDCWLICLV